MSAYITLTPGTLPQGYCFSTPQQFNEDIVNIIQATLPGTFSLFNFGPDLPDPADQDKPWIRTDALGNFDRLYTFYGSWVSPHPTPYSSAERRLWVGSEANVWAHDGGDGTDPSANPPTDTTGAMWEVDHDFDARFPLGPGTLPSTTVVAVTDTGGEENHTLTTDEIPAHTHDLTRPTRADTGDPSWEVGNGADFTATTASTGGGGAHNTMPPYYGAFFIKRTARKYYTVT